MNKNDFFREFIFRICGSLNIGEALWRCLLFIRDVMPADELILTVYNQATGVLEIFARADEKGFSTGSDGVPMPIFVRNGAR